MVRGAYRMLVEPLACVVWTTGEGEREREREREKREEEHNIKSHYW